MKIRTGFVSNSSSSSFVVINRGRKNTSLSEVVKAYCDRITAQAAANDMVFKRGQTKVVLSSEADDNELFHFFSDVLSGVEVVDNILVTNNGRLG